MNRRSFFGALTGAAAARPPAAAEPAVTLTHLDMACTCGYYPRRFVRYGELAGIWQPIEQFYWCDLPRCPNYRVPFLPPTTSVPAIADRALVARVLTDEQSRRALLNRAKVLGAEPA